MNSRTRRTRIAPVSQPAQEEETQTTATRKRRVRAPAAAAVPEVKEEPAVELISAKVVENHARDQDAIVRKYTERAKSPLTAIRAMCVQCMGGYIAEIRRCVDSDCALHAFRDGKNPYHKLAKGNKEEQDED